MVDAGANQKNDPRRTHGSKIMMIRGWQVAFATLLALSPISEGAAMPTQPKAGYHMGAPGPSIDLVRAGRGGGFHGGAAVRTRGFVGHRGGSAYRGSAVVRPGWHGGGVRRSYVRPGWHGGGVRRAYVRPVRPVPRTRWVRPARYWWPVGGAIAAGAAIGYVSAARAAAWAGAAPAPGYCWFYTDSTRRRGFWDVCPA
jgi:hypothetical protein